MWRAKAHMPKRARPYDFTFIQHPAVRSVLQNYSAAYRYYHQPGDQKYAQYSKIIRHPAAIITNQVIKSKSSTSKLYMSITHVNHT